MELIEIKGVFSMDYGSPCPTILSNDNELFIAFYLDKAERSDIPQERNLFMILKYVWLNLKPI